MGDMREGKQRESPGSRRGFLILIRDGLVVVAVMDRRVLQVLVLNLPRALVDRAGYLTRVAVGLSMRALRFGGKCRRCGHHRGANRSNQRSLDQRVHMLLQLLWLPSPVR